MERLNYEGSFQIGKRIGESGLIELNLTMDAPVQVSGGAVTFFPEMPEDQQILVYYEDSEHRFPWGAKFRVQWNAQSIQDAILDCLKLSHADLESVKYTGRVQEGFAPDPALGFWNIGVWADYREDFNPFVPSKDIPIGSRFPIVYSYSKDKKRFLFLQIDVVHGPDGLYFDFQSAYGADVLESLLKEHNIPYELWTGSFESRWGQKFIDFPEANSSTKYFTDNPNDPEILAKVDDYVQVLPETSDGAG
jgi:hypothetical protein